MAIWKKFHKDGTPEYLARNYWWAYIWDFSIWFWDHEPLVNMILFGNYKKLVKKTLERFKRIKPNKTLHITAVYGSITPDLAKQLKGDNKQGEYHLIDITQGQLDTAAKKLRAQPETQDQVDNLVRMNAENLSYDDNSFDASLIFFLLHELPPEARQNVLAEAVRVTEPGGHLIITEYGERTKTHFFHTFWPSRKILGFFEPYVPGFISEDLDAVLAECAAKTGKKVVNTHKELVFKGFYRNYEYRIENID